MSASLLTKSVLCFAEAVMNVVKCCIHILQIALARVLVGPAVSKDHCNPDLLETWPNTSRRVYTCQADGVDPIPYPAT